MPPVSKKEDIMGLFVLERALELSWDLLNKDDDKGMKKLVVDLRTPEQIKEAKEKRAQEAEHYAAMSKILYCEAEYKEIDGIIEDLKQKISEGSTPKLIELLMDAALERYKLKDKVDGRLRERQGAGLAPGPCEETIKARQIRANIGYGRTRRLG